MAGGVSGRRAEGAVVKSLDEYARSAEQAHGHMCAGQILGLRMALYGMKLLGIEDPGGPRPQAAGHLRRDRPLRHRRHPRRHRLPPGQARAQVPRFRQGGGHLLRSAGGSRRARGGAREHRKQRATRLVSGDRRQEPSSRCCAYRELPDEELFATQWVRVALGPEDFPGYKGARAVLRGVRRGHQLQARSCPRRPRRCAGPAPASVTTRPL